ncbi:DUF937 domain-containing protein [Lysobacter sp. TY2-98]|uniref:DUF937 domain-containing protein n=1 Tax=Lysobacter sp. TY2-98 TaxID=2290922 RepID=UPI0013B469BA|nr:DUF937 domain-containing protein [Lysobacter sp. TY2-98]
MNGPLYDDLLDQLRGTPARQLGDRLGLTSAGALQAAATALPVLLGALHHNTRAPDGADSLLSALDFDHRGVDPANALGTALAGGGSGAGILGHLFGEHRAGAADAVGQATGLDSDRASTLLRVLAPVVMAYLSRRLFTPQEADGATTPQPSADGLRAALGQEVDALRATAEPHPGLLSLLDRDHDGDVDLADFTGVDGNGPLPVQTAEMRSPRPRI